MAALLAAVAATWGVWVALGSGLRDPLVLGAALLTGLLVLVAWRSLRSTGHASIDDAGMVDIVSGDAHHRFDAANPATDIEVVGEPGSRDWQVLFHRKTLPPVAVSADMVDAEEFLAALRTWRPGL